MFELQERLGTFASVWDRREQFLSAQERILGPARAETGRPQNWSPAISSSIVSEIIAHLTFSLFLKFLGCYSELPGAPDNEKIEETMKNQTCLTSRRQSHCLPSHQPPDNGRGGGFAALLRGGY